MNLSKTLCFAVVSFLFFYSFLKKCIILKQVIVVVVVCFFLIFEFESYVITIARFFLLCVVFQMKRGRCRAKVLVGASNIVDGTLFVVVVSC